MRVFFSHWWNLSGPRLSYHGTGCVHLGTLSWVCILWTLQLQLFFSFWWLVESPYWFDLRFWPRCKGILGWCHSFIFEGWNKRCWHSFKSKEVTWLFAELSSVNDYVVWFVKSLSSNFSKSQESPAFIFQPVKTLETFKSCEILRNVIKTFFLLNFKAVHNSSAINRHQWHSVKGEEKVAVDLVL